MLYRKIQQKIENYIMENPNKVLIIQGARQIGKTYIIREIGKKLFPNFIELNMLEDSLYNKDFSNIKSIEDFYIKVSAVAGDKMKEYKDTLIFIDEIQVYPELITLLKFLKDDNRYQYIASGSLLGVTLTNITSIPIGTIEIMDMYPLDFEEFLIANKVGSDYINELKEKFINNNLCDEKMHTRIMELFKKYLIVGGMPDVVNNYIETKNIYNVRTIQNTIIDLYKKDCSKYDKENKLKIQRLYELIPSNMENVKKRIVVKNIEKKDGKTISDYKEDIEYIISAGISLEVKSVSEPKFPLLQSTIKSLFKLYMNDVGLLTCLLYATNVNAILNEENSINLGSVYETVVATELKAHSHKLYYYDNKKNGEVDYLVDDYDNLSILPIEVKSGKNYYIHSALNNLIKIKNYDIKKAYLLTNEYKWCMDNNIMSVPVYNVMFI